MALFVNTRLDQFTTAWNFLFNILHHSRSYSFDCSSTLRPLIFFTNHRRIILTCPSSEGQIIFKQNILQIIRIHARFTPNTVNHSILTLVITVIYRLTLSEFLQFLVRLLFCTVYIRIICRVPCQLVLSTEIQKYYFYISVFLASTELHNLILDSERY